MRLILYILVVIAALSLGQWAQASDLVRGPGHTTDHIFTEIWCMDGYRILYAENTENGTFQFFQIHQNAKIAIKGIECNGKEARTIE